MSATITIEKLFGDGKLRDEYLKTCIYLCAPDPVFYALVREFKQKPTKSKAIALYEVFCKKDSPLSLNVKDTDLAPANKELVAAIDELKKLKAEAEDMNFFKRVMTSKTRKPATDIFDGLVKRLEGAGSTDNAIGDSISNFDPKMKAVEQPRVIDSKTKKPTESAQSYFTKTWLPQRTVLEKAGFATVKTLK